MGRLTTQNLHFSREGRTILRDLAFEHEPGRVLTILGPSGSGKTTLLWLLAGLLKPDHGSVGFSDGDADHLGFVFQDGGLWDHLGVRGHLDVVLRGRSLTRRDRAARTSRVLWETGLSNLADRRPGQLSGGERQRLALARALVIEPRWLLLDEPTSQLDGPSRHELVELLDEQLKRTRAGVILATHQVDLATRLSDRIAVLLDGRIAQIDTPANVYERPGNLAIARLLGPAFEMQIGDEKQILRPHQLRFEPVPSGPFTVRACHFAGGHWHAVVADGSTNATVATDAEIPLNTTGRIHVQGKERGGSRDTIRSPSDFPWKVP